jgi:hypothetical protein
VARIRSIKPDFFRHEGLYNAERAAKLPLRLAFAGLWTAADREGRFRWAPRQLKLDCLPYDDSVNFESVLEALAKCGFILKYEVDGIAYGYIPSWHEHQVINQREAQSKLPVPSDASMCVHSTEQVQTRGEGKGREKEGKGNDITVADATRANKFDEFWKVYPKREGANPKEPARKLFQQAVRNGADPDDIIAGAKRCRVIEAKNIGTPYIPQTIKWLRDQRWNDYPARPEFEDEAEGVEVLDQHALEAWDAHRMKTEGKAYPRNKKGGWRFPTKWPPGQAEDQLRGVEQLLSASRGIT